MSNEDSLMKPEESRLLIKKDSKLYGTLYASLREDQLLDDDVTLHGVFKTLINLLLINAVFFIISNAQLTIILVFVNGKYTNDKYLVAALGSVNTILNLGLYPVIFGMGALVEILGSQAFGAKRPRLLGSVLHQARLFGNVLIAIIGAGLLIFRKRLFDIWETPAACQALAFHILLLRISSMFLEYEICLMIRYLQIIGNGANGIILITLNGLLVPFYCHVMINISNLHSFGCGLIYLCNNLMILLTLWLFILLFCFDKNILYIVNSDVFKRIPYFFNTFLPLYLLSLMDNVNSETMSFLANFFHVSFFSAYLNAYSLYNLFGTIPTAFNISSNIIMSSVISKDLTGEKSKKTFYYVSSLGFGISLCICGITYACSNLILDTIIEKGQNYEITRKLFYFAIACNFIEVNSTIINSTLKAVGKRYYALAIYIAGNVSNYFLITFFAFHSSLKILGIFAGFLCNDMIMCLLYSIFFFCWISFPKCAEEIKRNIEENDITTI